MTKPNKLKNWVGLKVMSFFSRFNFQLINLTNERIFEYPWCISRIKNKKGVIADFGCKGSMIMPYFASLGFRTIGIDMDLGIYEDFLYHYPKLSLYTEDIRQTKLFDNYCDIVFCISTIEHIFSSPLINWPQITHRDYININEDYKVLKEIIRITKPKGQIFLTMPYGAGTLSQGHIGYPYKIYNKTSLDILLTNKDIEIIDINYFIKAHPIWKLSTQKEIEELDNTLETKGTVCVELKKI